MIIASYCHYYCYINIDCNKLGWVKFYDRSWWCERRKEKRKSSFLFVLFSHSYQIRIELRAYIIIYFELFAKYLLFSMIFNRLRARVRIFFSQILKIIFTIYRKKSEEFRICFEFLRLFLFSFIVLLILWVILHKALVHSYDMLQIT